jgi:putative transposase
MYIFRLVGAYGRTPLQAKRYLSIYNCPMVDHPIRKPTRLAGFNYSWEGAYFITLVSHDRQHLFGKIKDGDFISNPIGEIIQKEWIRSAEIRSEIELDDWCVMPNHFHAIVCIKETNPVVTQNLIPRPKFLQKPRSLGSLVSGFKSSVTLKANQWRGTPGLPIWQRNYYDHIIRDEMDLNRIREYILNNPLKWELDKEYSKD